MSNYDTLLFVNQERKFRGFQKLLQPETRQAIMLIEAAKDMGKTWLVGRMQHHCQDPTAVIPVAQIDFRDPRQMHEIQDYLGLIRLIRNKLGFAAYFSSLNAVINNVTDAYVSANTGGLVKLQEKIEAYFNLDELQNLSFRLDINYENLPGDTLQAKARELISYCQRRNKVPDLAELLTQLRPQINWWAGLETYRQAQADTAATPAENITDNNAPIRADSDIERRRLERQINDAFFECLAHLMADQMQLVFLFDSYEAASPEADRWLRQELLTQLRDERLKKVTIIVTGRKTPDLTDLDIKHLLVQTSLEPFTEDHVREYFEERRRISGLDLRTILLTSGGVPGALAMMADHAMATTEDDDDFFSDL